MPKIIYPLFALSDTESSIGNSDFGKLWICFSENFGAKLGQLSPIELITNYETFLLKIRSKVSNQLVVFLLLFANYLEFFCDF